TITLPVRVRAGLQTMRLSAVTGGVSVNWFELQKNTNTAAMSPGGSGSYAAEPPDAALNSVDDLFDRVYVKQYDWINRPAGAALLDYGDWTVHYRMQTAGNASMDVTIGRGLPYNWFEFNGITPQLTVGGTFTAYNLAGAALGNTFTTDAVRIDNGGKQFAVF